MKRRKYCPVFPPRRLPCFFQQDQQARIVIIRPVGEEACGAAMFLGQVAEEGGIVAYGKDLFGMADDAGVLEQLLEVLVGHELPALRMEAGKGLFEAGPFLVHHFPVEAGVEDTFGQGTRPAAYSWVQRLAQLSMQGALRREWWALFKKRNAAVAAVQASLRARQEAVICVVAFA
jgi:hypothetical protein